MKKYIPLVLIAFFLSALTLAQNPIPNWRLFDANKDSAFDQSDLTLLLKNAATESTVDANKDGILDAEDVTEILILLSAWDGNADSRVDDSDFMTLLRLEIRSIALLELQGIATKVVSDTSTKTQIETQLAKEWVGFSQLSNLQRGRLYLQAATLATLKRQDSVAAYAYAQAVLLTPQAVPALNGLGFFLAQKLGRLQEALDVLNLARATGNNCETLNNLGWVYARAGMNAESLAAYSQSSSLCPTVKQYKNNLAVSQLKNGQRSAAAKSLIGSNTTALTALLNQNDDSTRAFDADWEEEKKQYPPIAGDVSSYLNSAGRIEFYVFQILAKNTENALIQFKKVLEQHIDNSQAISQIMAVPHQSQFVNVSQFCENKAHREKTLPIALQIMLKMQAKFFTDGLETRRIGTYELGNALISAEGRFKRWVAEDLATIARLEKDKIKAQELSEAVINASQDKLAVGRSILANAEQSGLPIAGLDNPMRYFISPPFDPDLSQQESTLKYVGGGLRPEDKTPIPCTDFPEPTTVSAMPVSYLSYFLEFLGNSILTRQFALDTVLVGVSYTPSDSEFTIRLGEGIFAEGTWNPKTGYGYNLGVGVEFKQSIGPIKLGLEAKAYLNFKSNGEQNIIYEAELTSPKDLFTGNIGQTPLELGASKSIWNPELDIQISPASHEPVLSVFELFGGK